MATAIAALLITLFAGDLRERIAGVAFDRDVSQPLSVVIGLLIALLVLAAAGGRGGRPS